ncbi:MAG: hypothetical protein ABIZ64_15400 [Casimicrobium sp.]
MKYLSEKSLATLLAAALGAFVLFGCAETQVNAENSAISDEKCIVTGSNLPSRRCRLDVITVAPGSLDSTAAGSRPPGGATR